MVSWSRPGDDRRLVELELGEHAGDLERVDQVGLARLAQLPLVDLRRVDVGLLDDVEVGIGVVGGDPLEDVVEADHCYQIVTVACAQCSALIGDLLQNIDRARFLRLIRRPPMSALLLSNLGVVCPNLRLPQRGRGGALRQPAERPPGRAESPTGPAAARARRTALPPPPRPRRPSLPGRRRL